MVIYLIIHKLPLQNQITSVKYNVCITKIWKKRTQSAELLFKNFSLAGRQSVTPVLISLLYPLHM
jgi:hypothetical protein